MNSLLKYASRRAIIVALVLCVVAVFSIPASMGYATEYTAWSNWSDSYPGSAEGRQIESKTVYRYRDMTYKYSGSNPLSGYEYVSTEYYNFGTSTWQSTKATYYYQGDKDFVFTAPAASTTVTENYTDIVAPLKFTAQRSYVYSCPHKNWFWFTTNGKCASGSSTNQKLVVYTRKSLAGAGYTKESDNSYEVPTTLKKGNHAKFGYIYRIDFNGTAYVNTFTSAANKMYLWADGSVTMYQKIKDRVRYKHKAWGTWSAWSDSSYTSSSTRQVETKVQYRYRDVLPPQVVSLSNCAFDNPDNNLGDYTYTGKEITPSIGIKYNNVALRLDTDYKLEFTDNINAGIAIVTITGLGGYEGTAVKYFTIKPRSLGDVTFGSVSDKTYTGSSIKPAPSLTYRDNKLIKGTDYTVSYSNNTKVGTASIKYTGTGNYTGSKTIKFDINQRSIKDTKIKLKYTTATYSGSAKKPSLTITYNGKTLVSGTDYTAAYSNNIKVGKAKVVINGKGNFKGSVTKYFTIKPRKMVVKKAGIETINGIKGIKAYFSRYFKYSEADSFEVQILNSNKKEVKNGKVELAANKDTTNKSLAFPLKYKGASGKIYTIKITKGQKYYFKVRARKTVGDDTYFGSWSSLVSFTGK